MPRTARGLHYEVTDLRAPWLRGAAERPSRRVPSRRGREPRHLRGMAADRRRAPPRRALRHARLRPVGGAAREPRMDHGRAHRRPAGGRRDGVRHGAGARDGRIDRRHHRARGQPRASRALCLGRHEQCGHQGRPDRLCAGLAGGDRAHRHRRLERALDGHAVRAGRGAARGPGLVRSGAGEIARARRRWPRRAADRHGPDGRAVRPSSRRCC